MSVCVIILPGTKKRLFTEYPIEVVSISSRSILLSILLSALNSALGIDADIEMLLS